VAKIPIAGPDGLVWVDEDSLTADEVSRAGQHHAAIEALTGGRDPKGLGLAEFEGDVIGRVELITDPERILDLDEHDKLTFENFYEV
jgi:hypothetical protein